MTTVVSPAERPIRTRQLLWTTVIILTVIAFSAVFLWIDNAYYRFAAARFPGVGEPVWLATL